MALDASRIEYRGEGEKGRFVYAEDGDEAELQVTRTAPDRITLEHTEVPPAFRGQGVGQALVTRAVEAARGEGLKITPRCPFAAAQFERNPDWKDVLAA